jgi:hypothetical protein
MSASAYDTAFLARLRRPDDGQQLAYPQSLRWLIRNQNPDGSFGTRLPLPKETLLSTMSALLALVDAPTNLQESQLHRARTQALKYLWEGTSGWQTGPDTAGFELLLPALLELAQARQLPVPYDRFKGISAQRDAKLGHLPPDLIYRVDTPLLHSLEYLGDAIDVEAARKRIAENGSFANSPSATAFYLSKREEPRSRDYLDRLVNKHQDGGVPMVDPWEVFEISWVLYNLARAGIRLPQAQPHLLYLAGALADDGVGVSRAGLRADADDTALTLTTLHFYGYPISMGPLRSFEGIDFFITFPLERDPSTTTNAHVLEVIRACPAFPRQHVMEQKVVRFLRDARVDGDHWVDKWHGSPFYATAHAVFALTAPAPDLVRPALRWLAQNQRSDGSWGWFGTGTAEETAYALQAWLLAPAELREGLRVDIQAARRFLTEHEHEEGTPMWIGKSVYRPAAVVRSAIIGARRLLKKVN